MNPNHFKLCIFHPSPSAAVHSPHPAYLLALKMAFGVVWGVDVSMFAAGGGGLDLLRGTVGTLCCTRKL